MENRNIKIFTSESESRPELESFSQFKKILEAGEWLLSNGFGKLQILPYIGPGGHWRCEFHPPGKPSQVFFRYSSSSGYKYLGQHCGGTVRKNIKPTDLAKAIMISVPDNLKERCEGSSSFETLLWLLELTDHLGRKLVPAAFQQYTSDYSRWGLYDLFGNFVESISPMPGYVVPGQEKDWKESQFWRSQLEYLKDLERAEDAKFLISISDENAVYRIATELARTLKEVDEQQAARVFKAAIAALAATG